MHSRIPLLFILLLPLVGASSPWFINDMDARLTFEGSIDVEHDFSSSHTDWVEGSFYLVPQESTLQTAEFIRASPDSHTIKTDDYGNKYIMFKWTKPSDGVLEYELVWDIEVDRLQYTLPTVGSLDDEIPESIEKFTEPDELTLWTGFMKEKAESIIEGSDSTLEAVRRLTAWVSDTLAYDLSCWAESYTAISTYHNRIGVCDEFTNLFTSLARSVGIPTRYVEGLVYSGEEWNYHAWAEVYIDGWIPVDATYNEVGFVDSSHIDLAKVMSDSDVYSRLSWEGVKTSASFGEDEFTVDIQDMQPRSLLALDINVKDEVRGLEIMDVTANLMNLANSNLVVTCALNMPVEMLLLDSEEKSVLLEPNGETSLSWDIATPGDLDKDWLHKMPVQVMCFPGTNITQTITIDPRSSNPPLPNAEMVDLTILNESNAVVKVRNEGTKTLDDLIVTLCIGGHQDICINKTLTNFKPAEIEEVFFSDIIVSTGDKVTAELYSPEFEAVALEARLSDLTNPELPPEPVEEPVEEPANDFKLPDITEIANGRGDDALLMAIAIFVAIALLAILKIVHGH